MKCVCCDSILTPREATNRSSVTGEFLDMCNPCIGKSEIEEASIIKSKNIHDDDILADVEELLNDSLGG